MLAPFRPGHGTYTTKCFWPGGGTRVGLPTRLGRQNSRSCLQAPQMAPTPEAWLSRCRTILCNFPRLQRSWVVQSWNICSDWIQLDEKTSCKQVTPAPAAASETPAMPDQMTMPSSDTAVSWQNGGINELPSTVSVVLSSRWPMRLCWWLPSGGSSLAFSFCQPKAPPPQPEPAVEQAGSLNGKGGLVLSQNCGWNIVSRFRMVSTGFFDV